MSPEKQIKKETEWESVHKCPRCDFELNIEDIDLKGATTGIAACPKCGWEGQINLQIVPGTKHAK